MPPPPAPAPSGGASWADYIPAPAPAPAAAPAPAPAPMPVLEKRLYKKFGLKTRKVPQIVDQIELYVRLGTSDCMSSKGQDGKGVVEEVFYKNQYNHIRLPYFFEPGDVLLDAGANIGTAAARQLAVGGRVYAYEPEPENY